MKKGSSENKNSLFRIGLMIFTVVAAIMVLFFILYRYESVAAGIGKLFSILQPIIVGLVIAYLVNPLTNFFTRKFNRLFKKMSKKDKEFPKLSLYCGIGVSLTIFILTIILLICAIIPSFVSNISKLANDFSGRWDGIVVWFENTFTSKDSKFYSFYNGLPNEIKTTIDHYFNNKNSVGLVESNIGNFVKLIYTVIINIATFLADFAIGIIVAIYALANKRMFKAQSKKMFYAFFSKNKVNFIIDVFKKSNEIFMGFITGKLISSLIIGVICFIGVTIMGIPYTVLITIIIAVTDLIPIFGPYIGAIPCALLIMLVDPLKCFYFVIFIIILQVVEGNIISPKVLSDSTGISAFGVVFSIVVGGGLFGIPGMLLGVPTFAVIRYIFKRLFEHLLKKKKMPYDTEAYTVSGEPAIIMADGENNEQEPSDKAE